MEIRRLFFSLVRKWWLIGLLAILGGVIGSLNVYYTKPVYQAETRLYVSNSNTAAPDAKSLNPAEIKLRKELVQQYSEIIYSRSVISAVSEKVNKYNLSENEILSMISIVINDNSNVFTISARGSDPTIVAAVANFTGGEFIAHLEKLSNRNYVSTLDVALAPNHPINNKGTQKILLGILLGLMVALGIIYVIAYYDTTVRSAEDIEKGLNLHVIGIIPEHNIR